MRHVFTSGFLPMPRWEDVHCQVLLHLRAKMINFLATPFRISFSFQISALGCPVWVLGVLIVGLLGIPHAGSAQSTATQQVHLDPGWNLVSLRVQPTDASFGSIFQGRLDEIAMVKDERGRVYIPSVEVEQISTWETEESYLIYVEESLTVEVSGTRVSPTTPILLEEGGNLVPYFPITPQAVEQALSSIEEPLIAAENRNGKKYNPSESNNTLDSLRSGQGYKVTMDQPDTLRYAPPQDTIVVNTLADALGLQGIEVGQHVRIRGYHEPGDGGGGLFQVTESACVTDGGTCFVFNENRSDEQVVVTDDTHPNFPHSNLVWGTLGAKVGPEEGERIEDLDMHAHHSKDYPWVDYEAGEIKKVAGDLWQLRAAIGGGDNYDITYRYKYATSDRRLVRLDVTKSVNLAWWGAPTVDSTDPQDATPYIAWAINKAHRLYETNNINWAYVDIPGEYYWHHQILLRNGVKIRGVGPSQPVPGESWTTNGKLITTPGKAIYQHALSFDADAENDVYAALNGEKQTMTNAYLAEKVGIEKLEVDGNYQNNKHPWNSDDYDLSGDKGSNVLQNGSIWSGFGSNDAGAQEWADGGTLHLNNVYVHDTGSNGIGSAGKQITTGKNVRLANSVRNHPGYGLGGDVIENLTIAGYAWEVHFKLGKKDDQSSTYPGFVFEDWQDNPEFSGNAVSGHISGNLSSNVVVQDFVWDFSDRPGGGHAIRSGPTGGTYKNGIIRTGTQGVQRLITMPGYRAVDVPLETTIQNVTIYNEGSSGTRIVKKTHRQINLIVKDVTVQAASGADAQTSVQPIGMTTSPQYDQLALPPRNVIESLSYEHPVDNGIVLFGGNASNYDSFPREWFIKDSDFNNLGSKLYNDGGRLGLSPNETQRTLRMYLDNVTFNVPDAITDESNPRYFHGLIGGDITDIFRLRNSQDRQGRVSDAVNQTFTSSVSDEGNDFVMIPTNLLSFPEEHSTTLTSSPAGISSITSVEVVDSNGNARSDPQFETGGVRQRDPYLRVNLDGTIGAGETVTIDWTARVTPLEDYRTTGLFVSRPVFDKTYAISNGPQTVDLRGVAVSQESKEVITYTASSNNPDVATVSVDDDGYTLTVAPQSTGTTTISVTGKIEGVGTATDTFEVSVE